MTEKYTKQAPYSVLALFLVCITALLYHLEYDMLWMAEEHSLWVPTKPFWESLTRLPGGILLWCSCFLTSLFFHPWMGCLLMFIMWTAVTVLTIRLYSLHKWHVLFALLPVISLAGMIVQSGYWLYYMKMPGVLVAPTLAVTISLSVAVAVRELCHKRWLRIALICCVVIVGYPLMGAWAFLAAALCCRDIAEAAMAIVSVVIVPLICYNAFYGETMQQYMWSAALPSYRAGQNSYFWPYHVPYYALLGAFALCYAGRIKIKTSKYISLATPFVTVLIYCVGLYNVWYRDTNFTKEIRMQRAFEERDWEEALRIYREKPKAWGHHDMPATRIMVMMKNVALLRLGRAGDEMFTYPDGAEQQHAPFNVKMTQVGGKMIYYEVGKETFCTRWNMEDAVEFGWRVTHLKYMAKAALVMRDWDVAEKYLHILEKTMWHGEWARKYLAYVGNEKKCWDDEELGFIMRLLPGSDRLDGDMTMIEMYLLQTFAHGMGADKNYAELTLMCAMIMQDIDLFWPRFFRYAALSQDKRMPTHYQEAAWLYGNLEPGKVDISGMPFDESVKRSYYEFCKFNQQLGSNMSEPEKAMRFKPIFGNTFYYFYFLVRNVKTN